MSTHHRHTHCPIHLRFPLCQKISILSLGPNRAQTPWIFSSLYLQYAHARKCSQTTHEYTDTHTQRLFFSWIQSFKASIVYTLLSSDCLFPKFALFVELHMWEILTKSQDKATSAALTLCRYQHLLWTQNHFRISIGFTCIQQRHGERINKEERESTIFSLQYQNATWPWMVPSTKTVYSNMI